MAQLRSLASLSFTILPGKYEGGLAVPPLYNDVYRYWKDTWAAFFTAQGSPPGSLNIENFMRHRYLLTLHEGGAIAGTLLCSSFALGAATSLDHPCVGPFAEHIRREAGGEGSCLTGEYLSVAPAYRKALTGLSLADVLIGLLMKVLTEANGTLAIATTVRRAGVADICRRYGYREVGSLVKSGVDCVMLYNTPAQLCAHPDPAVRALVERCWRFKRDETRTLNGAPHGTPISVAA